MARYMCKCGYTMCNTDDPAECEIDVVTEAEVRDAISYNPDISWYDFVCGWDELKECQTNFMHRPEVDYWYCTKCKRVYEFSGATNRCLRIYKRANRIPQEADDTWQTIFVVSDTELFVYCETFGDPVLEEFIYHTPHRYSYKMSPDETKAVAYDSEHKPVFAYYLEEVIPPKVVTGEPAKNPEAGNE